MRIRLVLHSDIDFVKWDKCISRSINGIVYAYSWYLSTVAEEWDAIVGDDYKVVFPLIHGQKYGISYLYQPFFTQQLGIFSTIRIDDRLVHDFINAIPSRYKYQIINFNTFNQINNLSGIRRKVTYQLDLIQSYFALSSKFNENTRRNISKALAMGVTVVKDLPVDDLIKFKRDNLTVPLKEEHFEIIKNLTIQSIERGVGEIFAAYSPQNELCAAVLFVRSNGKVIYLLAASNETGRTNRAMFALVDHFIHLYSESHLVLDFEGSMVDNIARFYAGFGASPCTYQQLVVNRLPWFVKAFMR